MEEDVHKYSGEEIEVSYDVNRCIHVRECVRGLPEVFDPDERPWIDPDDAPAEAVASVVTQCPTGALHFERTEDGEDEPVPEGNTITVATDGPLYLRGDIELTTPDEETLLEDTRVALCRCGLSANKPLCDNSHREEFEAGGTVADARSEADGEENENTGGPLTVTPASGGPLLFDGAFRVQGADGGAVVEDNDAALCRCGASGDKPFCDGSHADLDFSEAD
jgi:CDGSH-type Zn-finger protein/uncharacterized Fe-S cluster protein YjdI